MFVPVDALRRLQQCQDRIRNISVLAHVDHGKTTLSDNLIASNGLIHPKLVGELRYLDSREDEQIRGITMKSSSISLVYPAPQKDAEIEEVVQKGYLINLIDSPGHVDFCSEVSTAARLTDGCLILVDAVEGVCIQTHAVLRQAWDEKVHPCLVINKIDRLILSLKMTPTEVYMRLKQIISDVNLVMSTFESEQFLSEANAVLAHEEAKDAHDSAAEPDLEGNWGQSEDDTFSPIKGNVAFGSAIDGWGFQIQQFAEMYAEKLGAKSAALHRALWGDFCYQPKTKTVMKIKQGTGLKAQKPMFVQFILEPLYNAYSAMEPEADYQVILGKIVKGRELQTGQERALLSKDRKQSFKAVMSAWLPLSEAILSMVIPHLPSPIDSAALRMSHLLSLQEKMESRLPLEAFTEYHSNVESLKRSSGKETAPCIIYVSKMIAVDASWLPRDDGRQRMVGDVFLAFGRVFCGVARKGLPVHVLSAAYDPTDPASKHRQTATLGNLYLMMGRGLESLHEVPAGNVLAIEGLDEVIHKSATVSSTPLAPPLVSMTFQCAAIVRVAVEPALPSELPKLEEGLKKLSKADPFVEIEILASGEHVIGAAGEVHLLTCLKDLKERYAMIELEVSPPLVAFKESVVEGEEETRVVETSTPTGTCELRVRAHPLPAVLVNMLTESREELQQLLVNRVQAGCADFQSRLKELLKEQPVAVQKILQRAWLLGPKRTGPNVLLTSNPQGSSLFESSAKNVVHLNKKQGIQRPTLQSASTPDPARQPGHSDHSIGDEEQQQTPQSDPLTEAAFRTQAVEFLIPDAANQLSLASSSERFSAEVTPLKKIYGDIESGLVAGFQLATASGPLCDESMWGVAFEVDIRLLLPVNASDTTQDPDLGEDVYGPFQGQVMTVVKSCCRQAMLEAHPRLVEALYLCEVSTSAEFLSGVYSVISRRRGRILREELREGGDVFMVHAYLPVEASFGLADELRSKSSGAASVSVMLSHWERLEVDPFFVPTTEEEREEFGDEANIDSTNLARKLIYAVRKRKGLIVQEKVVESATKQRTRAKKV